MSPKAKDYLVSMIGLALIEGFLVVMILVFK